MHHWPGLAWKNLLGTEEQARCDIAFSFSASYSITSARQARASALAARSTADSVVARPSVSRTEPSAAFAGIPIANKTAEADSSPSWHADPVDAAICGVAARSASPEISGNRTLSVLGRRLST